MALAQIFESNNQTRSSLTYQIPDDEWESVQINELEG